MSHLAEDGMKVRTDWSEIIGRGEPEVDLETGRQEKGAVDGGGDLEVEVMQGTKLAVEVAAPIAEDRIE
jgi:hypothetical protein